MITFLLIYLALGFVISVGLVALAYSDTVIITLEDSSGKEIADLTVESVRNKKWWVIAIGTFIWPAIILMGIYGMFPEDGNEK